jgi:polyhydroxyalkanoate synthase
MQNFLEDWERAVSGKKPIGTERFVVGKDVAITPGKVVYGHWQNPNLPKSAAEWFETANPVQTSWWPAWEEWVSSHAGGSVKAREPGGPLQPIEDAPGSYVQPASKGKTHSAQAFLHNQV